MRKLIIRLLKERHMTATELAAVLKVRPQNVIYYMNTTPGVFEVGTRPGGGGGPIRVWGYREVQ